MIIPSEGNLFDSQASCLVNPVNCVGVMGKGLALQFKQRFPTNFAVYARACAEGRVIPGRMFVCRERATVIINFPTKRHWRDVSQLKDIEAGLVNLVEGMQRYHFDSIAIPRIGCGLGGLSWSTVEPLIISAFHRLPEVNVYLYSK